MRISMKHYTAALVGALFLTACGGGSIIDNAKKLHLAECPNYSVGRIVNDYFITGFDSTTHWLAYSTDDAEIVRITVEGDVLYVGVKSVAQLEVLYTEATDTLTLSGLRINDVEQPLGYAAGLVETMCDETKGL